MKTVSIPDPQRLELDALIESVYEFIELNNVEPDVIVYLQEGEPESVVFTGEWLDEAYASDYDEARECVMAVGERDLQDKINYWRCILNDMNEGVYSNE